MFKQLTALAIVALAAAACSVDGASSEELGTQAQELIPGGSCNVGGLEWKPFVAHLAYDAMQDFGRWEFTTDLEIAPSNDRLQISSAGFAQCTARGRSGCPAMTAGLSAQEGSTVMTKQADGSTKPTIDPSQVRSQLYYGFQAQQTNEQYQQMISDNSEAYPNNQFKSATKTGLAHTLSLTNCAATIYVNGSYGGASQCLRAGNYRMADLTIGNDQVSSIKVRSGMKVTLYEHDQFGGASAAYTGDASGLGTFNDKTSSLNIASTDTTSSDKCSAIDSFKVTLTNGGDWTAIRGKLVTLGYMRGNDVLDVRLDLANNTVDVDPFNVDFVPPAQIGGATYGVLVKSATVETWRSTEDPSPSIFPVGGGCQKKSYGGTGYWPGIVKSSGSYRYCFCN